MTTNLKIFYLQKWRDFASDAEGALSFMLPEAPKSFTTELSLTAKTKILLFNLPYV